MVDPLDDAVLERAADGDVVEERQVLDVLAQADAARVRADRDAELGGEQQDRDRLVDAADAARVELADVDRLGLEELLEDDPVLDVLAGRDPDRARSRAGCARARARRRGSSAPRSTTDRARRASASPRSPRRRPTPGWRPSSGSPSGPSSRRISAARRSSDARSLPTFIFTCVKPDATPRGRASRPWRRRSRASRPRSCTPGTPTRRSPPPAPPLPRRASRRRSSASSGASASVM